MPLPAQTGVMAHPTIAGAEVVAGTDFVAPWLNRYAGPRVALDIETYGLGVDANRIKVVVLAVPSSALVLDPRDPAQLMLLEQMLDDPALTEIVTHNGGPFDFPSLAANRIIDTSHTRKLVDTMLYARLAEPGETTPKTLDACADRYLGIKSRSITAMFKALGMTKTEGYARLDLDSPAYLFGAAADGIVTARLLEPIRAAAVDRLTTGHPFQSVGLSRYEAEWELERHQIVNRWASRRTIIGMRVDFDHLERFRAQNGGERARNEAQLRSLGIDPGNGNHLAAWLTKQGLLPADHPMTPGGKPSTAEKVLEGLNHPVARLFVATKKVTKLDGYMQKCIDQADDQGRIHPSTNILKAAHGRSAISGIEIHQFPAGARGIIMADDSDPFVSVDWSQQEPRIGMNLAQGPEDPGLLAYERGERLYTAIADYGDISDKQAKVVLLAGMYGEGLKKLSDDLGLLPDPWIPPRGEWEGRWGYQAGRELQDATFKALPNTRALLKQLKGIAKEHKLVFTVAGRILPIPSGVYDGRFSVQTHKGPNYAICGSAADEMTDAVVWAEQTGNGDGLKWNMHDEFICSASISHDLRRQMETPSERLKRIAGRIPVIRTDMNWCGERWIST
jgi:DNA polymerase-1